MSYTPLCLAYGTFLMLSAAANIVRFYHRTDKKSYLQTNIMNSIPEYNTNNLFLYFILY